MGEDEEDAIGAACGRSDSTEVLGNWTPLIPAFNALRKDAERYRWLRDNSGDCCDACGVFVDFPRVDCHRSPNKSDIDYAIDLAMGRE